MKTASLRLAAIASASVALSAASASAQLITNGSFESQGLTNNFSVSTTPDTSSITGWTLQATSGSVTMRAADTTLDSGTFPDAVTGSYYLAINVADTTFGVARIYQDFATTPGQTYQVGFSAGRSGPSVSGLVGIQADAYDVVAGNPNYSSSLGTTTSSSSTAGSRFYAASTFSFTAVGSTSRLVFADISGVTNGTDVLLDNVSVSAVPEPSSFAALAGLGVLGMAALRRRRA